MLLLLALRNLSRNRRRTLALLSSIAFGTCSIFTFDGFNTDMMNQVRDGMIHSFYGYGQVYTAGYTDKIFERPWEHWIDDWPATRARLAAIPGIQRLFPRLQFSALLSNGRITIGARGEGVRAAEEASFFTLIRFEQGELLREQPDGVMLGEGLARALDVKAGDRVTVLANTIRGSINSLDLVVTGIFHTGIREFDNTLFRLQLEQAQALLDTNKVECVSLDVGSLEAWPGVARAIEREMPGLTAISFATLSKTYYQNSVDWLDAQFSVIMNIILIIVLLGIFNMSVTAILERKQEIGNLRANGESFGAILRLLGLEGVALGVLGSALGLFFAFVLKLLLGKGILMPPAPGVTIRLTVSLALQADMALKTFLLGVSAATIATLLAAWKAARMEIAEALRSV